MINRKSRKKQNPERHHIQDRPTLDPREQLRLAFLALLVALPAKTRPPLIALVVGNLAAWLVLQATPLYGVGA